MPPCWLREEGRSEGWAAPKESGVLALALRPCARFFDLLRLPMIRSFRHNGLRRLAERDDPRGLPPDQVTRIAHILSAISQADSLRDLDGLPGLHPLKGDRAGFWAVRVSRVWRITSCFVDGGASGVDPVDYH